MLGRTIFLLVALGSFAAYAEETWHVIASDDFGNPRLQPHLISGNNYAFKIGKLDRSTNTIVFGNVIRFGYSGLDNIAKYRLRLRFTSDSSKRKQRILINGHDLKQDIHLAKEEITERIIDVPQALANTGIIDVTIEPVENHNVVISTAELLSSLKQKTKILQVRNNGDQKKADAPLTTPIPVPRLSPRPSRAGVVLDGTWKFTDEAPAEVTATLDTTDWHAISVPGGWTLQGFQVDEEKPAAYATTVGIPAAWKDRRIKLRFDAVYGDCRVFLNGRLVGGHIGTFTAFELDVTEAASVGHSNTLVVIVTGTSIADLVSNGSLYACHPLGGIIRSVHLFALPRVHFSDLVVRTEFDPSFTDCQLRLIATTTNEGTTAFTGEATLDLEAWTATGAVSASSLMANKPVIPLKDLQPGESRVVELKTLVRSPKQWNCEAPHLYVANCQLRTGAETVEIVRQRFGFRQIEVRGDRLYVNGMPVKLRGVNRHEVHPRLGRTVPDDLARRDVELFRAGNVNLLRTSHYPPDEALLEACDELGMFVECEGPQCWSHNPRSYENQKPRKLSLNDIRPQIIRNNLEMLIAYRNHPSILFWSLANESKWNVVYEECARRMEEMDPTRPRSFGHWHTTQDMEVNQISSAHYKGYQGIKKFDGHPRPVNYGEYAHLNAYNRHELATDPAVRTKWGTYLHRIWEMMYPVESILGGSTWAGIDDTFYWDFRREDGRIEERTVGYGTWGPIDGWRRKKPEWWGMKKTYSPIWIAPDTQVKHQDGKLIVPVQNRQYFTNLDRLVISWNVGEKAGAVLADLKPGESGRLEIPFARPPAAGDVLALRVKDPRGFEVNRYRFPLAPAVDPTPTAETMIYSIVDENGTIKVSSRAGACMIDKKTGLLTGMCIDEQSIPVAGPKLMLLTLNNKGDVQMHGPTKYYQPHTSTCSGWQARSVEQTTQDGLPVVRVSGSYKEAEGTFTYRFRGNGALLIEYDFTSKIKMNPRQLGIVFEMPGTFEVLNWKRRGFWTTYPDWHIARLEGTAIASDGFKATPVGPRTQPSHEWRKDMKAGGSNDFCSTKHGIHAASLTDAAGFGLEITANGDRHARAWILNETAHFLVAHYSNGGSERYLRRLSSVDDQPLKKGDQVRSTAHIRLIRSSR